MNSTLLREGLLNAKIVPETRFNEFEEADRIRERLLDRAWYDDRLRKAGRRAALETLVSAKTPKDFAKAARFALTHWPDMITEVIEAAHALKHERGGKKLIWRVYQVRDHLPSLGEKTRENFLSCAFGRNGIGFLTVRKQSR